MGKIKIFGVFIAIIVGALFSSFTHEYYVSIANIYVNKKSNQFEIEVKIDADDLEKVLYIESGKRIDLENIDEVAKESLKRYLTKHFQFHLNGAAKKIEIVGEELNPDGSFWCYFTVDLPDVIQTVKIKNDILLPTFLQQHNIINLKIKEMTYSHTYTYKHSFHTFKINDK